jgi:putative oxidoreductase
MNSAMNTLPAVGRVLLALIFVLAGIDKLTTFGATAHEMATHGIPYANDLVWGVVALELGGGILLIVGLFTRLVAAAYFCYLVALAFIFHPYWTFTGAAAHTQHIMFYEHVSMMGGMLYVVAFGAGPFSLDALIWGRRTATAMPHPQPAE